MLVTEDFMPYPALTHVANSLYLPHSFIGLWPIHPVLPDPSDPQTYTNTGSTKCVSSSEPEEVSVWKEASFSCLVSFFVCAVNTVKRFQQFCVNTFHVTFDYYFFDLLFWKLVSHANQRWKLRQNVTCILMKRIIEKEKLRVCCLTRTELCHFDE